MSKHPSTQVSAGCEPRGPLSFKAVLTFLLFAFTLALSPLTAQAAKKFDHDNTGFVLNGAHQKVACETCHVRGVFKGTPKTCEGCHAKVTQITADKKSDNHMKTSNRCDDCHSEKAWRPSKTDHTSVLGQCKDCHSAGARIATAKPTNHIQTEAPCDTCHKTTTWSVTGKPAGHDQIMSGCSTCHLSIRPSTTRSGAPHPTTDNCESCHSTSAWYPATASGKPAGHDGFTAGCNSCHSSARPAMTNGLTHTSSLDCSECHRPTGWKPWKGTKPSSHNSITNGCESCHSGTRPATMPHSNNAPHPTTGDCAGCHTVSAWYPATAAGMAGAKPAGHDTFTSGCNSCHSAKRPATTASGAAHPTVNADCSDCHRPTGWTPWKGTKPTSHASITNGCESCHAATRPATTRSGAAHPPTGDCSGCHSVSAWYPATVSMGTKPAGHDSFTSGCDGCHAAIRPATEPHSNNAPHPTTPSDCAGCHKTSGWYPSTLSSTGGKPAGHDSYTSGCNGCHLTGGTGKAKSSNHIPSVNTCETCHFANRTSFARPTAFNHSMTTLPCVSCHITGMITYNMNTSKHMPILAPMTSADCGACHNTAGENGSWKSTRSTIPHAGYINETDSYCKTCHNATNTLAISTIQYKGSGHVSSTEICGACHTDTAWSPSKKPIDHTQLSGSTTTCANCHTKDMGNHFPDPTKRDCGACHSSSQIDWKVNKTPKYDHLSVAAGTCDTCHAVSVTYIGTIVKYPSSGHFSFTAKAAGLKCDACHTMTRFNTGTDYTHLAVDAIPIAGHGSTRDNCAYCHSKNNDTAYHKSTAYLYAGASKGTCGGCHGSQFTSNLTKHTSARTSSNCKITNPAAATIGNYTNCVTCHPNSGSSWDDSKSCIP